jgi:glycosyltransferase involved in cell wall biosynthesis
MSLTVSVLVAAYNEVHTLPQVIDKLLEVPLVNEIIVVDDGSTDGTAEFLKTFRHDRVKIIFHPLNQGKTAAIQSALAHTTGDVCLIQDADLEYNPEEIPAVLAPILSGKADVVYGSRFLVRKESRVLYFYHFLANKLLTFLSNLLTNLNMTDIETGYKSFRTHIVKDMGLSAKGFGMEIEITALVSKVSARVYEVPISYYGRTYEEGKKISLIDGIYAIGYIFYFNLWYFYQPQAQSRVQRIRKRIKSDASSRTTINY